VADKLTAASANGAALIQEPPQPMTQALVDEVLDSLKTEANMFYRRGGVDCEGNDTFDVSLEGAVSYVPGVSNFCKLYRIKCMVSTISGTYNTYLSNSLCVSGWNGGPGQLLYT
jgi:hypothetical protein